MVLPCDIRLLVYTCFLQEMGFSSWYFMIVRFSKNYSCHTFEDEIIPGLKRRFSRQTFISPVVVVFVYHNRRCISASGYK